MSEPKVTRKVGQCDLYVVGMSMACPLCGVVVQSGGRHSCKVLEARPTTKKRRPRRV